MHGVEQHSGVLDRLGRSIASVDRVPGTVLTLAGLEEEFGVSRTLVREVVRVLEKTRPAKIIFLELVGLNHRAHRPIKHGDARAKQFAEGGEGRGLRLRFIHGDAVRLKDQTRLPRG
jgi:hypothetical protein